MSSIDHKAYAQFYASHDKPLCQQKWQLWALPESAKYLSLLHFSRIEKFKQIEALPRNTRILISAFRTRKEAEEDLRISMAFAHGQRILAATSDDKRKTAAWSSTRQFDFEIRKSSEKPHHWS